MTTYDIEKMSVSERIQAMETLWESLRGSHEEIESPRWHFDILDRRKQKMANNETEFISLDELAARRK